MFRKLDDVFLDSKKSLCEGETAVQQPQPQEADRQAARHRPREHPKQVLTQLISELQLPSLFSQLPSLLGDGRVQI